MDTTVGNATSWVWGWATLPGGMLFSGRPAGELRISVCALASDPSRTLKTVLGVLTRCRDMVGRVALTGERGPDVWE